MPPDFPVKRASIHTLGCRLNQSESLLLKDKLEARGYRMVPFGEPADLGIINTCTVTNLADAKCRNAIRSFVRRNPEAFTAVVGCYSQMGHKAIAEIPGVDLIVGNQDKLSVLDYVGLGKSERPLIVRDRIDKSDFSIHFAGELPFNKRANLKVQDGCDFMCSFCIIPFARGRARARNFENLLDEARSLAGRGVRELVLTGVNIGTYADGRRGILDVVAALDSVPGIDRIRISSIEPTTIPEELFAWMRDPGHALLPYLHIPLQSGCDRILEAMRRKYSVSEYLDFIRRADSLVPDLCIGTDIMVGFPGETEAEFDETCRVFQENPFAYCHVFTFSEREGTPAVGMADPVPANERARRSACLRRLSASRRHAYQERYLGGTLPVLFEDPKPGLWTGYTGNYIRVVVEAGDVPEEWGDLRNRIGRVRLERLSADFVEGRLEAMED